MKHLKAEKAIFQNGMYLHTDVYTRIYTQMYMYYIFSPTCWLSVPVHVRSDKPDARGWMILVCGACCTYVYISVYVRVYICM